MKFSQWSHLKYLIALLLCVNVAQAQTAVTNVIRNDSATTVIQSNNLGNSKIATNDKGVVFVSGSSSSPLLPDRVSTGTLSMTSTSNAITLDANGLAAVGVDIASSSATGTIQFEVSADGTTFYPATGHSIVNQGTSMTFNAQWNPANGAVAFLVPVYGAKTFRARVQSAGINSVVVTLNGKVMPQNDLSITGIIPGTAANYLGKAKDAAAASTDTGVAVYSIRDDTGATKTTTDGDYQGLYTNAKGALRVDYQAGWQSSIADGLLKNEDGTAASGDAGVGIFGVTNEALSNFSSSANGDYVPMALARWGSPIVAIQREAQISTSGGLLQAEDAPHVTGDSGVAAWAVANTNLGAGFGANGDYTPIATAVNGAVYVYPFVTDNAGSAVRPEDAAHASGDAAIPILYVRRAEPDAYAAQDDYTNPIVDVGSRIYVNPFGTNFSSFSQGCTAAMTGTSDTAALAAVASYRAYIGSISCVNTSGSVASLFTLKDGATVKWTGFVNTTALPSPVYTMTFPTPIRGTANTAVNFAMTTTATSTTCCADVFYAKD